MWLYQLLMNEGSGAVSGIRDAGPLPWMQWNGSRFLEYFILLCKSFYKLSLGNFVFKHFKGFLKHLLKYLRPYAHLFSSKIFYNHNQNKVLKNFITFLQHVARLKCNEWVHNTKLNEVNVFNEINVDLRNKFFVPSNYLFSYHLTFLWLGVVKSSKSMYVSTLDDIDLVIVFKLKTKVNNMLHRIWALWLEFLLNSHYSSFQKCEIVTRWWCIQTHTTHTKRWEATSLTKTF